MNNEIVGSEALLELIGELDVEQEENAMMAWSQCCCFSGCGVSSNNGSW